MYNTLEGQYRFLLRLTAFYALQDGGHKLRHLGTNFPCGVMRHEQVRKRIQAFLTPLHAASLAIGNLVDAIVQLADPDVGRDVNVFRKKILEGVGAASQSVPGRSNRVRHVFRLKRTSTGSYRYIHSRRPKHCGWRRASLGVSRPASCSWRLPRTAPSISLSATLFCRSRALVDVGHAWLTPDPLWYVVFEGAAKSRPVVYLVLWYLFLFLCNLYTGYRMGVEL